MCYVSANQLGTVLTTLVRYGQIFAILTNTKIKNTLAFSVNNFYITSVTIVDEYLLWS